MRKKQASQNSAKLQMVLATQSSKPYVLDITFVVSTAVFIFYLISLFSYHFSPSQPVLNANNVGGVAGAKLSYFSFYSLGYAAYLLPLGFFLFACQTLKDRDSDSDSPLYLRVLLLLVGASMLLCCSSALIALCAPPMVQAYPMGQGGWLGQQTLAITVDGLGVTGSFVLWMSGLLLSISLLSGGVLLTYIERLGWVTLQLGRGLSLCLLIALSRLQRLTYQIIGLLRQFCGVCHQILRRFFILLYRSLQHWRAKKWRSDLDNELDIMAASMHAERPKPKPKRRARRVKAQTEKPKSPNQTLTAIEDDDFFFEPHSNKESFVVNTAHSTGKLPTLDLLTEHTQKQTHQYSSEILEAKSREVEQRLLDFGVEVNVVAVYPGPVIMRFELQLAPGLKVSKITALGKDLARSLSVTSVRVVEVIPGKTVVGLELPNEHRAVVTLREVLASSTYAKADKPLTLALGVDIAGEPVIADLAKMPHLLVAGTTGSGKSVGINAMLLSLLYKSTPDQIRLILVDPKMLELSVYDGIPHLLTPVVTDMKDAAGALRWCVQEMERRYRLMAALGVRNLGGFNRKLTEASEQGTPLMDPTVDKESAMALSNLPRIVVVIDELADMMMVVGKKVEQLIARIAQKARAAGIHMVLATQRPSVDVLTGLIKSNIPTRIAFQVSSKIDSRTILDQQGAEQLLGHGDMLFLAPGTGTPIRVHGAFVDDNEVHRVADALRQTAQPDYIDDLVDCSLASEQWSEEGNGAKSAEESDALYDEAVAFVTQSRKASISAVQRRFKIGYNRAANLVESMEQAGVVSAMESGVREVLAPAPISDEV